MRPTNTFVMLTLTEIVNVFSSSVRLHCAKNPPLARRARARAQQAP